MSIKIICINMSGNQVTQAITMLLQSVRKMVYWNIFPEIIFLILFNAVELFTAKFQSLVHYLPFQSKKHLIIIMKIHWKTFAIAR